MTGSISQLSGILAQYREKLEAIDKNRLFISDIIKSTIGITVKEKELEISNNILLIHSHPAKRQIIMFNKIELLGRIQENNDLKNILDIK